ncbi:YceI family protein [Abyssalbus ytuae]|uniref:YceI family protein n=1 Tax=Abyssalbus ytuae TaxID=2926907 RepID=A0A9E6ZRJ8_9FLAO|nr:YceI family protein [Abyssalbus ytuae]UOB17523.1 YceI family protein [Abyssalbus ytuae]
MKLKKYSLSILALLLITFAVTAQENLIRTDPNTSYVNFSIEGENISGTIAGVDTFIILDKDHLDKSSIQGSATVKTINTGNFIRDKKLLGKKHLNEKEFPTITFESTNIQELEPNVYMVEGDLTIKDITERIYVEAVFAEDRIQALSHFNTFDFELSFKGDEHHKVDLYFELFYPDTE